MTIENILHMEFSFHETRATAKNSRIHRRSTTRQNRNQGRNNCTTKRTKDTKVLKILTPKLRITIVQNLRGLRNSEADGARRFGNSSRQGAKSLSLKKKDGNLSNDFHSKTPNFAAFASLREIFEISLRLCCAGLFVTFVVSSPRNLCASVVSHILHDPTRRFLPGSVEALRRTLPPR